MENIGSLLGPEKSKCIPVPPGFVSLTSFTLKRVEDSNESSTPSSVNNPCEAEKIRSSYSSSRFDVSTIDLKNRPWILHRRPELKVPCPEPEVDIPLKVSLPRGVIRGCSRCPNCLKVISGWCPEDSRRIMLESGPVFYPTEEEFKDPLQYISSIRPKAEQFGICSIIPPPSWKSPCIFQRKNAWIDLKFKTRIQQIGDHANLNSSTTIDEIPGNIKLKRKRVSNGNSESYEGGSMGEEEEEEVSLGNDRFKSEVGPEFSLEAFKEYADDFKRKYFYKKANNDVDSSMVSRSYQKKWEPSVGNIEGEFWRILEKPTEEIEVICGANIDTREFQSGFPVEFDILENPKHLGWNLNNIAKLPGSLLQFETSDTCAPSVPQVFMGMCLSSQCWKLEEHQLYSSSYLHLGSSKIWYGIPARYCYKFKQVMMKKHLPQMLSPSVLKSEGIPVYRCVQHPKQFVITFPGAYHYGLDCGFNVMETVNFAPFDWLPFGHHATELYREEGRKTSISYDKLLLGGAMAAVMAQWETLHMKRELLPTRWSSISGKDGLLTNLLKIRVRQEASKKKYLCRHLQSEKMNSTDFDDVNMKMECRICLCDLHLSAISCLCSPRKYTCAVHANHFCSAASDSKRFLFRFEVDELDLLIQALEGDLGAVKTWGMEKFGLTTGIPSEPSSTYGDVIVIDDDES